MNWPTHTDYQDAMQNPGVCFQEPELKTGEAACDMLGLPRVMSGNFASVYELKTSGTRYAVRCFVRQVPGQQGRYSRLSQYLNSITLDCLVDFEFMLKGILVKGEWFPIVKMHWVEGSPLNTWVEEHINDSAALLKLAADWRVMMDLLKKNKLAHGDLQHGNIMVSPQNELRLVDYDGMYAPVFGRGRAPELGHINFQHPRRTADFYQEDLDNFAALVIYTSLRALAAEPELWQKFYTVDNLVLVSADYKAPLQSAALERLKQSKELAVQQLAKLIERSCCGPVECVPDFDEVMKALDAGTLEKMAMKSGSVAPAEPFLAKRAAEAGKTPAAAPAVREKTGSRSAYDNVPTFATTMSSSFKPATPAPAPAAASYGQSEKKGVPGWVWGVACGLAAAVIVFVVMSGKKPAASAPPSNNSPAPSQKPEPAAPANNTPKPQASARPGPAVEGFKISLLGTLKAAAAVDLVAYSRDGKTLASSQANKTLSLWEAQSGKQKKTISGFTDNLAAMNFLPDDKTVATVSQDNAVQIIDITTGQPKRTVDQKKNLFGVAVSPDGQSLATGDSDRKVVRLVDLQSGAARKTFPGHSSWVKSVAFSADGSVLAVACHDDSIALWDVASGKRLSNVIASGNTLDLPVLSPNGKWLATADNRALKIWDVAPGELKQTFTGHNEDVKSAAFSSDGKMVVSGSSDKGIRFFDVTTGALKLALAGHNASITALALSADGNFLASGSADQSVKLWEVKR